MLVDVVLLVQSLTIFYQPSSPYLSHYWAAHLYEIVKFTVICVPGDFARITSTGHRHTQTHTTQHYLFISLYIYLFYLLFGIFIVASGENDDNQANNNQYRGGGCRRHATHQALKSISAIQLQHQCECVFLQDGPTIESDCRVHVI